VLVLVIVAFSAIDIGPVPLPGVSAVTDSVIAVFAVTGAGGGVGGSVAACACVVGGIGVGAGVGLGVGAGVGACVGYGNGNSCAMAPWHV